MVKREKMEGYKEERRGEWQRTERRKKNRMVKFKKDKRDREPDTGRQIDRHRE